VQVVALVMARDEARVIRRCLDSLRGVADRVVVVDTGSADGTPEAAEAWGREAGVPVHVRHAPWEGFGPTRTAALGLARTHCGPADYVLFVDADMTVAGTIPRDLTADAYRVTLDMGGLHVSNTFLTRAGAAWRYVGATHECLACDTPGHVVAGLDTLTLTEHADSSRRTSGRKLPEDADLLEREIAAGRGDPRTWFYLARSYDDMGRTAEAVATYRKRIDLPGGYADERWYSLYRVGCLTIASGGITDLLAAWEMRPGRWEPVYAAVKFLREQHNYHAAYALARMALDRPADPSGLFVHPEPYQWGLKFEASICAYYVNQHDEALRLGAELTASPLPDAVRAAVERNMAFSRQTPLRENRPLVRL